MKAVMLEPQKEVGLEWRLEMKLVDEMAAPMAETALMSAGKLVIKKAVLMGH